MTSTTGIPPEIILSIAEQLPRSEGFTLRHVCKSFSETLASECLRKIIIDVPKADMHHRMGALKALALETEKHPVRGWAQALTIKRFHRTLLHEGSEALSWVQAVSKNFANIKSLQWAQDVEYFPFGEESPDVRNALLVQALQLLLPRLREVQIVHALRGLHLPILDGVCQLSRLSVRSRQCFPAGGLDNKVYDSIHRTIARSSETLECLSLALPPAKGSSSPIAEMLQAANVSSFPRLREVELDIQTDLETTCTIKSLTSHFPSLQALHLCGRQPYSAQYPSSENDIFTILQNSGIHLREVSSYVSAPFLGYLASYEDTVEKLSISDSHWGPSNRALSRGFNSVLAMHRCSLRELIFNATLDDGWAFGSGNQDLLLEPLPSLEVLKIPVYTKGQPYMSDPDRDSETETNYLRKCLDQALDRSNFPRLHRLLLSVLVDSAGMRSVGTCGRYYPAMYKSCNTTAVSGLHNYRYTKGLGQSSDANASSGDRPPLLTLGTQEFFAFYGVSGGWRFVPNGWNMKGIDSPWEST